MSRDIKITYEGDSDTLFRILSGTWNRSSMTEWEEDLNEPDPVDMPTAEDIDAFQTAMRGTAPSAPLSGVHSDRGSPILPPEGDWNEPALAKHEQAGPAGGNMPSMNLPPGFDFGALPLKDEAWEAFRLCVTAWTQNFDGPVDADGVPLTPQPDRLKLLTEIGSGRWPLYILRWIASLGSLQAAVRKALDTDDLDLVDRLSANIVQVSHIAFPDIAGFHDYSTKWSRT